MIYAIDFDQVLTFAAVQQLVIKLVKEKNEIWIVTMRKDNEFNRKTVSVVIDKLPLTIHNVIFCDSKPKLEMLQMINADIYIDNINNEFLDILSNSNTIPLLFNY